MTQIKIIRDGVTVYDKENDFAFVVAHSVDDDPMGHFLQFCDSTASGETVFCAVRTIGDAIKNMQRPIISMAAIASIIGGAKGEDIDLTSLYEIYRTLKEQEGDPEGGINNDQEG